MAQIGMMPPRAVGRPIRLMIIDDSPSVRRVFQRMLDDSLEVQIVASIGDAREAVEKIPIVNPDAITLDVEMPGLGGIEALQEILRVKPDAKVIMLSALTQAGAPTTDEALRLGAVDCMCKPGLGVSASDFKKALCAKLASLRQK